MSCLLCFSCGNDSKPANTEQQTTEQDQNAEDAQSENQDGADENSHAPKTFKIAKVRPVNDSRKEPVLKTFLDSLVQTLKAKDVDALLAVVSPDIKVSFGAENGIEAFRKHWGLDQDPENSKLWSTLKNIIELGGTFDGNQRSVYATPYYYNNFPDTHDPFVYSVITGKNVNIRKIPNRNAKTVRQLNHEVVIQLFAPEDDVIYEKIGGETHPWQRIRMSDGEEGYVYGKYVQSPIGYRAIFEKLPQVGWQLYVLVAGD